MADHCRRHGRKRRVTADPRRAGRARVLAACCFAIATAVCSDGAIANDRQQSGATDHRIHPGADLDLGRYRGSVVVVHFWATWCKPCLEEMPSLIRFHSETYPELEDRGEGLRLVLISRDLRRKDLEQFLAERDHPFPVYFDPRGRWMQRLEVPAVPATLILGPDGRVLERTTGTHDWQGEQWLGKLREATGQGGGK